MSKVRTAILMALSVGSLAYGADPQINFEKYKLSNGLTVILSEDHRLPQVAVDIWYHVGAANQRPGKSGFAHLFEHMMFSGAKHIGPSPFRILEMIGTAAGAMANGTTDFDRTNYFEVVPAPELPTALWLESDRMGFLLDTLSEKKLKIQRDVVSNERRQSVENQAYGEAFTRTCDLLYPSPHPYYECVIGSIPEIQAASMDDLRDFFRQYYAPSNASLALVGDFDSATAKELIQKYFEPIPRAAEVRRPDVPQPMLTQVIRERLEDKVAEVPRYTLIWNGVKPFGPGDADGDVLGHILGQGKTSRLYRALVFDKKIASHVVAFSVSALLGGWFEVDATPNTGRSLEELKPAVQAVINEIREKGPTAEEVERAKRAIIASLVRGIERIGGFGGKADQLNNYEMFLGDPGYLSKDIARYRAVTPETLKAFAQKYLPDDRRIELDVVPASAKTANAPSSSTGKVAR